MEQMAVNGAAKAVALAFSRAFDSASKRQVQQILNASLKNLGLGKRSDAPRRNHLAPLHGNNHFTQTKPISHDSSRRPVNSDVSARENAEAPRHTSQQSTKTSKAANDESSQAKVVESTSEHVSNQSENPERSKSRKTNLKKSKLERSPLKNPKNVLAKNARNSGKRQPLASSGSQKRPTKKNKNDKSGNRAVTEESTLNNGEMNEQLLSDENVNDSPLTPANEETSETPLQEYGTDSTIQLEESGANGRNKIKSTNSELEESGESGRSKVKSKEGRQSTASNRKISAAKRGLRKGRIRLGKVRQVSSPGMSNIQWPTGQNFDADVGKAKIIEFIEKTWQYDSLLEYSVEHLYTAALKRARRFKYRVCWVGPSSPPATMATASIYFNLDVQQSPNQGVDVSYTFQSDRQLHRPGRSRYHEKWLADMLEGTFIAANA